MLATADICDRRSDAQVATPLFRDYGRLSKFFGPIATLRVFEDNSLVRKALEQPGQGQILVIDGGGSTRCALVGDRLATLAIDNGWAGIVVYGCIRDCEPINAMPIGIKALGTSPRKSIKRDQGERNVDVVFATVRFTPGHYLYADPDGIVVVPTAVDDS